MLGWLSNCGEETRRGVSAPGFTLSSRSYHEVVSIYATALALDGDEADAPIVYQASHVLPAEDDTRAGSLLLCQIPGFISRADRVLCGDDDQCPKPDTVCCDRVWPYLRLSLHADGEATAVLDHAQVQWIHAYLSRWLERADPEAA